MHILHVASNLEIGGITRFVEWMVALNDTSQTHHDVLLGTSSVPPENETSFIRRHCRLRVIDPRRGAVMRSTAVMWRLAKEYDAFFIHAAFPVAVLPLVLNRKPCLIFQHGMMPGRRSKTRRRVMKWWYSALPVVLNAKVVCSTPEAHEKVRKLGIRVRESKVVVIPFGIPLSSDRLAQTEFVRPGTLTVGMAGRLVEQKRHMLAIQSLAVYGGSLPIRLLIAGDGPLREELQEAAASVKTNVTVEFLGEVHDMRGFYDRIDLALFPSRNESFGLVVPEAFDRCVPVAVFDDVGGCLSLIRDGENGFVMSDGLEGLTRLWRLLDRDRAVLQSMSRNLENADLSALSIERTRDTMDRFVGV